MENSPRRMRSGYEPSDTENEEHESPWRETNFKNVGSGADGLRNAMPRNVSPLRFSRRHSSRFEYEVSSPARGSMASPPRRRHLSTKSPLKPTRDDGRAVSPLPGLDLRKNISPLPRAEGERNKFPYRGGTEESNLVKNDFVGSSRRHSRRTPTRDGHGAYPKVLEVNRVSEKTNHRRRYATAPRLRGREEDRKKDYGQTLQREEIAPPPSPIMTWKHQEGASHPKEPSIGEINEMVAMVKLASDRSNALLMESIDSISAGDIFFSRDHTVLAMQKSVLSINNGLPGHFSSNPDTLSSGDAAAIVPQLKATDNLDQSVRDSSTKSGLSQTTITSSSARSGKNSSKHSKQSGKWSDATGRTSGSFRKFTDNMMKSQYDGWLTCIGKGSCGTSKSPEHRPVDESAFIAKAFVVENLRKFWADKHQPASLNGFTCHKQEAQLLLKIVSHDVCPNILFKGPVGSGKRALTMALLREIYGDACWNLTHELRYFLIQERRPMQVVVPITSSTHHVELNIKREAHARYALMGIVKEISSKYAITPEVSNVNPKPDYKVIVLFDVDKAAENLQHLIKWIMDCYPDACKLILCCEDDVEILALVKTRCKVIKVDAPVTHEAFQHDIRVQIQEAAPPSTKLFTHNSLQKIIEVLTQIARKENFDLPTSFAAKIASKSKQNLRQAIMALEACKAHNYPFIHDQPIPLGWEEVLVELAADILADPSQQRLYLAREKLKQLLLDFVHPSLILQKLVEQFLKRVEGNTKRELYYWHAYYSKKLPAATTALLKLEEFVAKFMSIYRKSSNNRQYV